MSLASLELSFIKKPTGQKPIFSKKELSASVDSFGSLVDDTLLKYPSKVRVSTYTTRTNSTELSLGNTFDDGSQLLFEISSEEVSIGLLSRMRSVFVAVVGTNQRQHKYVHNPGILEVARTDRFPMSEEEWHLEQQRASSVEYHAKAKELYALPIEEQARLAKDLVNNSEENRWLDREMNLNHLPVGAPEILNLKNLIDLAHPLQ